MRARSTAPCDKRAQEEWPRRITEKLTSTFPHTRSLARKPDRKKNSKKGAAPRSTYGKILKRQGPLENFARIYPCPRALAAKSDRKRNSKKDAAPKST